MNIYTYTSNNPDKPGYYAEVVNSEGEVIHCTGVYTEEMQAHSMATVVITNMILEERMLANDLGID